MFTGDEEHEIAFEEAGALTKRYRDNNRYAIKGGYFSKHALQAVLTQTNCVGIRIYLGNDEDKEIKFVIVGVDIFENDLVGEDNVCMEFSKPCPERCSVDNILNS